MFSVWLNAAAASSLASGPQPAGHVVPSMRWHVGAAPTMMYWYPSIMSRRLAAIIIARMSTQEAIMTTILAPADFIPLRYSMTCPALTRHVRGDEDLAERRVDVVDREQQRHRVPSLREHEREKPRQQIQWARGRPGEVGVGGHFCQVDRSRCVGDEGQVPVGADGHNAGGCVVAGGANDACYVVLELEVDHSGSGRICVALAVVPDPRELRVVQHIVSGVDVLHGS
eukprot:scaffold5013_cov273-Pinguiococcus_pyrenoidosus.AAC.2